MSTGNADYNLRYPKGFKGYPFHMIKSEGYGQPKGYITLLGVGAVFLATTLYFSYGQANKREYPTKSVEWKNATLKQHQAQNSDPIYQLMHDKRV
ncbi:cytochrome c oxidase subunit VI [Tieghemostelium lacteum]|uniref:Cytochrome c oxidase subunit VI n=1 Tax=Tieghemostelium lacteum TaxID=361077 RepID=A0A152A6W3_TIELA|nr:cytochrome c oxidase subunit VI [Tieghemostelium lacteum]|eukprot:KYR01969.1 cytochrome c oxidase subunit VI [Tieghemostelium lacteum]